jgi:hypothetical protein
MDIQSYNILISSLPVKQQSFTTKRATWLKAEKEISWLKQFNDYLFGSNSTMTISRQDIFKTNEPKEKIIKTIYWGYTAGMRGNNFINILKYINIIENALLTLSQNPNPSINDFLNLTETFKSVPGLGLSTYSKLLYFFKISFNNNYCMILDQRIIDVFSSQLYENFQQLSNIRYNNAEKKYLDYLQIVGKLSKDMETEGENIELFLFTFGNNLKSLN